MKNKQTLLIIALIVIIALAMVGCNEDDPPIPPSFGDESTAVTLTPVAMASGGATINLSTNVTADNLSWTCKTYTKASGVNNPYSENAVTGMINNAGTKNASVTVKKAGTYVFELTASNTGSTAVTKTVTVVVNPQTVTETKTAKVTVGEVASTVFPSASLNLEVSGGVNNNYSFAEVSGYFSSIDFADITYTLSSIDPTKTAAELNAYISNGVLSSSAYGSDSSPIITQTFYYKGEVAGSRKFQVRMNGSVFNRIYAVNSDNSIGSRIDKIPSGEITLGKNVTETIPEL